MERKDKRMNLLERINNAKSLAFFFGAFTVLTATATIPNIINSCYDNKIIENTNYYESSEKEEYINKNKRGIWASALTTGLLTSLCLFNVAKYKRLDRFVEELN